MIFLFQFQSRLHVPVQPQLRAGDGGDPSLRAGTRLAVGRVETSQCSVVHISYSCILVYTVHGVCVSPLKED